MQTEYVLLKVDILSVCGLSQVYHCSCGLFVSNIVASRFMLYKEHPTVCQSRVKAGEFGHQVNSDIHLQTVEILMRRLLMSRLNRIFTVC